MRHTPRIFNRLFGLAKKSNTRTLFTKELNRLYPSSLYLLTQIKELEYSNSLRKSHLLSKGDNSNKTFLLDQGIIDISIILCLGSQN